MLYLKLVLNEFKNQNHDKRELLAAEGLGYKVQVLATTKEKRDFIIQVLLRIYIVLFV